MMNDIELIDEIVKRAEEHQKQREKDFAIAELKNIKAEIQNRSWYHEHFESRLVEICETDKIIDNHIKELKGENNDL